MTGNGTLLATAFVAGLATMFATGLGAIPVLFTRYVPERLLGLGYAFAGGMMVAVSFLDLIAPGTESEHVAKDAMTERLGLELARHDTGEFTRSGM